MPSTPAERRALAVITAIAALGVVTRAVKSRQASPAPTPAQVLALDSQIARVRAARAEAGRSKSGTAAVSKSRTRSQTPRDTTPRPLVDLDTASVGTIEALPWVGASLAARIVESRDRCGPFGSIEALKRVYGIGDGMAKRLAPYVTFSMPSRPNGADLVTTCSRSAKGAAPRRRGRS